jgi:hypothetical protein
MIWLCDCFPFLQNFLSLPSYESNLPLLVFTETVKSKDIRYPSCLVIRRKVRVEVRRKRGCNLDTGTSLGSVKLYKDVTLATEIAMATAQFTLTTLSKRIVGNGFRLLVKGELSIAAIVTLNDFLSLKSGIFFSF